MTVDGDERLVRLYAPDSAPKAPMPLVIFLHSSRGTPASAARETHFGELAVGAGFVVAMPPAHNRVWDAPVREGAVDPGVDQRFLSGLIEQLTGDQTADPERVYVAGFSIGAVMAGQLACRLSDQVAAAAVVGGTPIVGECDPSVPVSMLIIHGTGDSTFTHAAAEQMADDWRTRNGCTGLPMEAPIGTSATASTTSDCASGTAVEFVSVDNGPHQWFTTPDATALAWQFFVDHGRD